MSENQNTLPLTTFAEYVDGHRLYGRFGYKALDFRCRYLFADVDSVDGKTMLDIGGGTGLFSAWAVANGARCATNLEPEIDGSSNGMLERFRTTAAVDKSWAGRLVACDKPLQAYDFKAGPFDLVLSNASINHLDEDCCIHLRDSTAARTTYVNLLTRLKDAMAPGGWFVVSDAENVNYWNRLGLTPPFAKSIEWHKHQEPDVWARLFEEAGFERVSVRWHLYYPLRFLGRLCANRFFARMTSSLFVATFRKPCVDASSALVQNRSKHAA